MRGTPPASATESRVESSLSVHFGVLCKNARNFVLKTREELTSVAKTEGIIQLENFWPSYEIFSDRLPKFPEILLVHSYGTLYDSIHRIRALKRTGL